MNLPYCLRRTALALTLAFAATSQAQNPLDDPSAAGRPTSARDATFLLNAAQASLTEIELGRLAAAKSAQGEIKSAGEALADAQARTKAELRALAERRRINVPAELPPGNATVVEDLQNTSAGPGFDRRIVGQLVRDQRRTVSEFESAARTSRDPEIRGFAARNLPALRSNLGKIEEIQSSL